MRKTILFLFVTLYALSLFAQEIVTTRPQLKAAIFENFTGLNCPYCPGGATAMQNSINANPGKVWGIAVHVGYFAEPQSGQPDFRTSFGQSLVSQANISGYPNATVNRHFFSDLSSSGGTGMGTTAYGTAAARIIQQPAYANIGFQSSFNNETRELTVEVEVYYVENLPFGIESNFINVALTESNLIAYQAGGGSSYNHKRVLRHLITGQWGDEISEVQAGSLVTKTYTYTVSEDWNASNCELVVFLSETHQEIINGAGATLIDGFNNGEITPDYGRIFTDNSISNGTESEETNFEITVLNGSEEASEFVLSMEKSMPADWQAWFEIDGNVYETNATIEIQGDLTELVNLVVVPGEEAGVANCKLIMTSVEDPSAAEKMVEVFVVSKVKNLIVNGSGTNTSVDASDYEHLYQNALIAAGCDDSGIIPGYALIEAFDKNILDEVENIYLNISYTIPVMTKDQTAYIKNFVDAGGNLFLAGQDIAKDIMDTGGQSGHITQKLFFQNYMGAAFINGGSSANNNISFLADYVFGGIAPSAISSPYSGEGHKPDNLTNIGTGITFLEYPNENAGGIRNEVGDAKIVYIAFGIEQVNSAEARNEIMDRTYKWFTGQDLPTDIITNNNSEFSVYPNPATNVLYINTESFNTISITDLTGRKLQAINYYNSNTGIDLSNLSSGMYYLIIEKDSDIVVRSFVKK
jgi:hypothetical protein